MATLEQLSSEKYVLLTTFRKDGRAVATPLWAVPHGAGLAVWTPADTGKVKRIRNSGRVTVQPCDIRGNPHGEVVEAHAVVGGPDDLRQVRASLKKKYGAVGWLTVVGSRLRRGADGTVAVLIS
jgi:PPOX class probable F420-dependent enzyme